MFNQLFAKLVDDFLTVPHLGFVTHLNISVPEVTTTHVFESKVLPGSFNQFLETLDVGLVHRPKNSAGPDAL
jgi:hypothetical protein